MRVTAGLALIALGVGNLWWVYTDQFPKESLKAEELAALEFWTWAGWIATAIGLAVIFRPRLRCPIPKQPRKCRVHSIQHYPPPNHNLLWSC